MPPSRMGTRAFGIMSVLPTALGTRMCQGTFIPRIISRIYKLRDKEKTIELINLEISYKKIHSIQLTVCNLSK